MLHPSDTSNPMWRRKTHANLRLPYSPNAHTKQNDLTTYQFTLPSMHKCPNHTNPQTMIRSIHGQSKKILSLAHPILLPLLQSLSTTRNRHMPSPTLHVHTHTHTILNNIRTTKHNKVVLQTTKFLLSHSSTIDTFLMNADIHLGSPPKTQSLHGYTCTSTPQDHVDALPDSDLTPCHHHHLPEGNHTLHHPKLKPTNDWIHITPKTTNPTPTPNGKN